ncbi:CBS domain-containing protein [Microvirga tunisiensis]|uniref:CBS domain-containing protein n=2 Tax=Pannonibacter tanglangensis TaxID=2750084 RepID=A0A7X5F019_9HYPH|nr:MULTISPECIES: CBS domain-containing protein [unclassified Pannonibacter]NBN63642.1 CBS domain-containing protein [Pannonibacter sp. XCT-34]NBN77276.1 CBS domain-containing protein [Pannonibacter sp. XCT-53]
MTVASILNQKGRDVVTARASDPLGDICKTLSEKRIGAIVITDGAGHIEGIVSERDVVRVIGEQGPAALQQPVSTVMTRAVVTCSETDTINSVMAGMSSGRFRHMPVVSGGRVIGLVSIGDIVKHRIAQVEQEAEQMRHYIAMA